MLTIETAKAYVADAFKDASAFSITAAYNTIIGGAEMVEVTGHYSYEAGQDSEFTFDVWEETRDGETFLYGEW